MIRVPCGVDDLGTWINMVTMGVVVMCVEFG